MEIQEILDKINKHKPQTRPLIYVILVISLLFNAILIADKMNMITKLPEIELKVTPAKTDK